MSKIPRWRTPVAALLLSLCAFAAHASVVLNGTRVIYPEAEPEVTVRLTNDGDAPALVQAWIDDGNAAATPDQGDTPFTLAPPLFRLDPGNGQTLRIIHLQQPLPRDRESLFWLNVLEVPPVASGNGEARNSLQFAFRSRIKLMFRPKGLPGDANRAPQEITWRFVRKEDGSDVLAIANPTPYHVTFTRIEATATGTAYRNDVATMVEPQATIELPMGDTPVVPGAPVEVRYTTLNDFGAAAEGIYISGPTREAGEE